LAFLARNTSFSISSRPILDSLRNALAEALIVFITAKLQKIYQKDVYKRGKLYICNAIYHYY